MPVPDGVWFYDRKSGRLQRETVVAEGPMRWCYGTRAGRALTRALLARSLPSRLYGLWQASRFSRSKIRPFVQALGIDLQEAEEPVEAYRSFHEFFTRRLKPEARPLDPDPDALVSPADGRAWAVQEIRAGTVLPIKGVPFQVERLLGREDAARRFHGGSALSVRLCPADYHRFHFPAGGVPAAPWRVGGALHSVNPHALASGMAIYDGNRREVTLLSSERFGALAIVEVGAMFVGRIVQTFEPGRQVERGEEKGYFTFGASTLVLLAEPGRLVLDADLVAHTAEGYETLVRMGTRIGRRAGG